jgi:hypothetical protein
MHCPCKLQLLAGNDERRAMLAAPPGTLEGSQASSRPRPGLYYTCGGLRNGCVSVGEPTHAGSQVELMTRQQELGGKAIVVV